AVEDLNPLVAGVGDIHVALRVERDAAQRVELTRVAAPESPRLDEVAVLVELRHPRVAAVHRHAVGDVDVAGTIPGDVRRTHEAVAGNSGSWRPGRTGAGSAFPAAATLRCPAPFGARTRSAGTDDRPHADRLRLPAEHQLNASVRIEFDHVARSLIGDPDVVLRIDADRLREIEAVDADADLAHELAGLIELEEAGPGLVERPRRAERGVRRA